MEPGINDLCTTDPEVMDEWDFDRNGSIDPKKISRNSLRFVWWKGSCGHHWRARIVSRIMEQEGCSKCRKAFAESKGNLCERCLKRGVINPGTKEQPLEVHHKVPLNADNVKDPNIALGWDNLELLCKQCHDEEKQRRAKRWRIGPDGRVIL